MISEMVSIIDRLIQLLSLPKARRRKCFEDFVEPLFSELTLVHKDYVDGFWKLRSIAHREGITPREMIAEVRIKKAELSHLRVKLRSLASALTKAEENSVIPEVREFARAILDYFGIAAGEDTYQGFTSRDGSWFATLLDLLEHSDQKSIRWNPNGVLRMLASSIEERWSLLTLAYASARVKCLR